MLFSWEKLSEIFTFSYFRYLGWWFAITPVAISIISGVKENNYFNIKSISLPFSWEILWGSSLFYVFGYILFIFSCPIFIKKYKNLQNYEKLAFPKDYIMEEWINFIKKFRTTDQLFSNKEIQYLSENKMIFNYEGINFNALELSERILDGSIRKFNIEEIYSEGINIYLNCEVYRYVFCTIEATRLTTPSEETIFKKYYLYLSEVYEKERIGMKRTISTILWISIFLFAIILAQNIHHVLIYIYFDFLDYILKK